MDKEKTADSRYIQQHLANERTFLAWVRTSITIVGLGFLASGIVFRSAQYQSVGHYLAMAVGIGSVLLGSAVLLLAVQNYFRKQKGINDETFRSPRLIVLFLFASLSVIDILLVVLILILMLK